MPRISSTGRIPIDKERLIDRVKNNSELYYDTDAAANDSSHKKSIWKNIAKDMDAPVDVCQRAWLEIKENLERDDSSKDFKSDRRKSLRSGSSEKNLGCLEVSSVDNSNDNSRASSNCASPKNDDRRRLRSSSRSLSHLGAISETDLASLASSSVATITPKEKTASKSGGQTAGRTPRKLMSHDEELRDNNINERYQMMPRPAERNLRPRFSEPSLLASKEIIQAAAVANTTPRRQSGSGPNGRNGRMRKSPNPSDSTRAFFESMALTVSGFPQHLQAAMKVQICTMVAETEWDLSSPKIR